MRPSKRFTRPATAPDDESTAPRRVFSKGRYSTTPPMVVDPVEPTPVDPEGEQHVIDHGTSAASYGEGFSKYDGRSMGGHVVVPAGSDEPAGVLDAGDVRLDVATTPVSAPETVVVDLTVRLGAWDTERRYEHDRYWRKDSRRL